MGRSRLVPCLVLAISLATGGAARAQQPAQQPAAAGAAGAEQAKHLFEEGLELEKQKNYPAAYAKFHESAQLKASPGNLFHEAYCLEMTGKFVAALDGYDNAEKLAVAENRTEVRDAIRSRNEPLSKRVPSLVVKPPQNIKDVQIIFDGAPAPAALIEGKPVRVDPGAHDVAAKAPGYETFGKHLTLAEGSGTMTVDIVMEKTPPPATVMPGEAPHREPTEPPREAPKEKSLVLPIVTTAGAVVFAGAGVASLLVAGSAHSDAERDCPTKTSCDDEQSTVRTFDALALTAFVGAVGLGALSVVLWATSGSGKASGGSSTRATRLVARPASIGLEGSF